ncbi:MAG: DUF2298 domain-containing protein [Anaerolineae bacterium]
MVSGQRLRFLACAGAILLIAGILRFYNLNWDQGTHLHPDERYLTMVVSAVRFPGEASGEDGLPLCADLRSCIAVYWDTDRSPLNPATHDRFSNYVYGTLPLFATRAAAGWVDETCAEADTWVLRLAEWSGLGSACGVGPGYATDYDGIHLIGRFLSGVADLAALVGTIVVGWLVFGRREALMAGLLYALSVLPIQHAHFFVVDSFATVFVIWTLAFAVWSWRAQRRWLVVPAGALAGLAVASKISVWPLVGIVALAAVIRPERDSPVPGAEQRRWPGRLSLDLSPMGLLMLVLSGLLSAVAFRVAQPYAFSGPGFFDVALSSRWLTAMREVQDLMRGLRDVPFGHQWTARAPILFPWRNMVVWGLGLPLGIAAWVGWAITGWDIVVDRRVVHRRYAPLLPWLWGSGFFLYQATQWVKSMRYLLPIYPVFALFAAALVVRMARLAAVGWPRRHERDDCGTSIAHRRLWVASVLGRVVPYAIVAGAALWALAFVTIYSRPVTRIEASRWIYENIPTAIGLQTQSGGLVNVPVRDRVLTQEGGALAIGFEVPDDARIVALVMPKASGSGATGSRTLEVSLLGQRVRSRIALSADGETTITVPLDAAVDVTSGEYLALELSLLQGAPVHLMTSVVANEHWDDPLPLRIDGRDPFWNWYEGLSASSSGQMNLYDADTWEKHRQLLDWLDEADYIVLSSNRLYASIPRLPQRYPLTTEYYRALFDGSLGFDLVNAFVSYPTLGPCQFPDQENPFALVDPLQTNARSCSIALPPAEEAFSVYDHPTVLIFGKTQGYSRQRAEALLPVGLVEGAQWVTPRQAARDGGGSGGESLVASSRYRRIQEAGGTWSRLFNRRALQNRFPGLAVILWAAMLTIIGWIAFPVVHALFPALRHRGYGLARILGLLIWSYIVWLLASLRVLPFTRAVLWGVLALFAVISAWVAYRHRDGLREFLAGQWRRLLTIELLFLGLYLAWVGVRWLNPDLWHPVTGGEKFMDFAYLNAVIKSTWFPPYDPWFAGGVLNYYYFGFVMVASLVKALGIVPSVAYNLAVPTFFALTGIGAYTLATNLVGGDDRRGHRAGLWGLLLVLVLGNLSEIRLLARGFIEVGNVHFESLIPGYPDVVSGLVGLWKVVVEGVALPFRREWWYWDATRLIPYEWPEAGPINEFPVFTFLYADLHAHMMALPLTQAALAIALQWAVGVSQSGTGRRSAGGFVDSVRTFLGRTLPTPVMTLLLAGLVGGALRATNTWDYPTYLALMVAGFLIGHVTRGMATTTARTTSVDPVSETHEQAPLGAPSEAPRGGRVAYLAAALVTPALLLVCAELLFRPFTQTYQTPYAAFELWEGSQTPVGIYLWMYGQMLFPIAVGIAAGLERMVLRARDHAITLDSLLWPAVILVSVIALVGVLVAFFEVPLAWLVVPLGGLVTVLLIVGDMPVRRRVLWFWVGTALALSLLVEVAVLEGDISRMNTVFKFHLQVWMLLGVSAAVFTEAILRGAEGLLSLIAESAGRRPFSRKGAPAGGEGLDVDRWKDSRILNTATTAVGGMMVVLVLLAALYPAFGIPAKAADRWAPRSPRTLDGMAYMQYAAQIEQGSQIPLAADYRVIRWLQDNVAGSSTIMEMVGEREYLWGNRISVYTGLPAVVGWRWHQVQQRMVMPPGTVETRRADVEVFYSTIDAEAAHRILERYQVGYVILGPYERAYMMPVGLTKFVEMVERGWLEVVYRDADSTIYRVVG